jgi:hypothetical protein
MSGCGSGVGKKVCGRAKLTRKRVAQQKKEKIMRKRERERARVRNFFYALPSLL